MSDRKLCKTLLLNAHNNPKTISIKNPSILKLKYLIC